MSKVTFSSKTIGAPPSGPDKRFVRIVAPVLAVAAAALLSGCMQRDSIKVGAIPDDYRTNHPIVIAEKEEVLDLPVGRADRGITKSQKIALEGFLARYDRSASPVVRVMVPSGAANDVAAADAAAGMVRVLKKNGVPGGRIAVVHYQAGSAEVSAPIRISYIGVKAQTNKCGRWPEDMLKNSENKHYANFGCSYQNNLAAQIADPADLLGPRKSAEIDAGKRGAAIDVWQTTPGEWTPEVNY